MMERPILMTVESVQGIRAGRKIQTRRAINWKVRPESEGINLSAQSLELGFYCTGVPSSGWVLRSRGGPSGCWNDRTFATHCPYGSPGDRLWVREPWRVGKPHDERNPTQIWDHLTEIGKGVTVLYEAGGWKSTAPLERPEPKYNNDEPMPTWAGVVRSSMFMPRWASRITLEITDVRVERVQDITEEDARAEGCSNDEDPWWRPSYNDPDSGGSPSARKSYEYLWDMINGKRQDGIYAWQRNPWCWVLEFSRVS
jgi:hypothetical protein